MLYEALVPPVHVSLLKTARVSGFLNRHAFVNMYTEDLQETWADLAFDFCQVKNQPLLVIKVNEKISAFDICANKICRKLSPMLI